MIKSYVPNHTLMKKVGFSLYPSRFSSQLKLFEKSKKMIISYKIILDHETYNLFSETETYCKLLYQRWFENYISQVQDVLSNNPKISWNFVANISGSTRQPSIFFFLKG